MSQERYVYVFINGQTQSTGSSRPRVSLSSAPTSLRNQLIEENDWKFDLGEYDRFAASILGGFRYDSTWQRLDSVADTARVALVWNRGSGMDRRGYWPSRRALCWVRTQRIEREQKELNGGSVSNGGLRNSSRSPSSP